jgi:hypothetical protein
MDKFLKPCVNHRGEMSIFFFLEKIKPPNLLPQGRFFNSWKAYYCQLKQIVFPF